MKCQKCQFNNPDTVKFCGDCGTQLTPAGDAQPSFTRTLETPKEELTSGSTFADRYQIIEELGKGGMGKVYRVVDKKLDEEVALKLIKPEIASDKKIIERFKNELKLSRKIGHRNVGRMFELQEYDGTHYITMEYVAGQDLKGLIKQSDQLTVGKAVSIALQICEGLAEAHQQGVVHRDLKPNNIMIDKEGNARILDFGIARSLKAKSITGARIMIGTPEYMSPEQIEGKEVVQRSDIYSLGIILYEMLTGRLPFEGDTPLTVGVKQKSEKPGDPREHNPGIPEDLTRLILRCLEKEKINRYQSAEELVTALNNIDAGIPSTSRETSGKKSLTSKQITVSFTLKKILVPAVVFAALVGVGFFGWRLFFYKGISRPLVQRSIAVISFQNQTGEAAFDYLQDAIPNLLVTSLEQSQYLQVTTWERLHDLLKQIGKDDVKIIDSDLGFELCRLDGIEAIVLGSYIKAGDMFATDVKVLEVESKKILKSYSSRGRGAASILETQIDELSREIALGVGLSERKIIEAQTRIQDVTTASMEAYNYFLKGREEYEKFYYDEARLNLEKAVELDPAFAVAYLYLGFTYSHLRYVTESHKVYEKAMAFSSNASDKEKHYIKAQYAGSIEKNPAKRFQILKEAVRKYPKEKRLHYLLGSYYRGKKLYPEAEQEFQLAIELDPQYGTAVNALAYNYTDKGNFEKAIENFKRYVQFFPEDANPLASIGDLYFRMGRLDEAIAKFKEALEIKPDFGSELEIAYIYALKEDYAETIRWLDHFIDVAPSPGLKGQGVWFKGIFNHWLGRRKQFENDFGQLDELWKAAGNRYGGAIRDMTLAWIYYDLGDWELSRKYYDLYFQFIKNYEPQYLVWNTGYQKEFLGMLDIKQGRLDSARSNLEEAIKLRPEMLRQRPVWTSQTRTVEIIFEAELLLAEGRIPDAIEFLENSSPKEAPQMTLPHLIQHNLPFQQDLLAQAYYKTGALDKAIAEYERLITFDPESGNRCLIHPLYYYRLAGLCMEKSWQGKAIEYYEKFLNLWKDADPRIAEVENAKKRLAEIQN